MLVAMFVGSALVLATILVHYEILRGTWTHLKDLPIHPRLRIVVVIIAAFGSHMLQVWIYGLAYWLLAEHYGLGGIRAALDGSFARNIEEYVYFSAVTYTSLGFGDLIPTGHFRLLIGIEGLNGLVLIAWTASFSYLAMQEYWPLHGGPDRTLPRDAISEDN